MPYDEMLGWFSYFKMRPLGWREDHRTSLLMQQNGMKEKPEKVFSSLAAIHTAQEEEPEHHRIARTLKDSGLLGRLMKVAAQNNVEWNLDDQIRSEGNQESAG